MILWQTLKSEQESTTDLNNTDFVNVKATTTKDTQLGTNVTALVSSVKVGTIAAATSDDNGLATALDVRNTIEGLDADFTGDNAASDSPKGNVKVSLAGLKMSCFILRNGRVQR